MARKAINQVTTITVGISRNTGHLTGLANVIEMSPAGHKRTLAVPSFIPSAYDVTRWP